MVNALYVLPRIASDYHFWLPLLITPSVSSTLSFDGCLGESLLWGRHIETVEVFSASYLLTGSSPLQHVMGGSPITNHMLDILMYKLIFSVIPNINNPCLENRIYYYQRLKKINVFIVKIYLYVIKYVLLPFMKKV